MTADESRQSEEHPSEASTAGLREGALDGNAYFSQEQPREFIGPYRLLSILGEGGFGIVWLAERREPHVQRVALKIIKPGMDSKAVIARFEQERQALAVMDHPNVAKVYDAGTTPQGRPYFVMELVQGEPITEYCDRHNLTIRRRLELFIAVCEAVQHAHHKGVIHRDIKPSNVLVTIKDETAIPKVIDFGVAKAISHTLTDKTVFTETGQLIGTPEYMSPEQAEMGALDIDTRTDVYSLGVLLYELLTGVLPFDPSSLREGGYDAIRKVLREQDPPRPSTRLSTADVRAACEIATHRQSQRDQMVRELRRELDWIPLKAMRKDRAHRYATPTELVEDIRNYLTGRPLQAGPQSASYHFRKFLRRNRGPVVAAALCIFLAFLAVVGTMFGLVRAKQGRLVAEENQARAEAVVALLQDVLGASSPEARRPADFTLREFLKEFDVTLANQLNRHPTVELTLRKTVGNAYLLLGDTHSAEPHLQSALQLARSQFGPSDHETILCQLSWAWLLHDLGRYDDAEAELLQGLETLRAAPEEYVATEVRLTGAIADMNRHQRRFDEALKRCDEAIALAQGKLGTGHIATLEARQTAAWVYRDRGQLDEAETILLEVLNLSKRFLGEDDRLTIRLLRDLGGVYLTASRLDEATKMYEAALAAQSEVYGRGDPQTLADFSTVFWIRARAARTEGDWDAALRNYEQRIDVMKQMELRLPDDPYWPSVRAWCELQVAAVCGNQDDAQGRARYLQVAQQTIERALVASPHDAHANYIALDIYLDLSDWELEQQKNDKAVAYHNMALKCAEKAAVSYDVNGPRLLSALIERLVNSERPEFRNIALAEMYVSLIENWMGQRPYDAELCDSLQHIYWTLANAKRREKSYAQAIEIFQRRNAVVKRLQQLQPSEPSWGGVLGWDFTQMALLSRLLGRNSEQVDYVSEAIKVMERSLAEFDTLRNRYLLMNSLTTRFSFSQIELNSRRESRNRAVAIGLDVLDAEYSQGALYLNDLAWHLLTAEPEELQDAATALIFAEEACRRSPRRWTYLDTLALAQFKNGNTEAAYQTQSVALDLAPSDEPNRAMMNQALQRYEQALDSISEDGPQ